MLPLKERIIIIIIYNFYYCSCLRASLTPQVSPVSFGCFSVTHGWNYPCLPRLMYWLLPHLQEFPFYCTGEPSLESLLTVLLCLFREGCLSQ